jgi:hypothetical protein
MREVLQKLINRPLASLLTTLCVAACLTSPASAQDLDLTPVKGQAPEIKQEEPNQKTMTEIEVEAPASDEMAAVDGAEEEEAAEEGAEAAPDKKVAKKGDKKGDKKADKDKKAERRAKRKARKEREAAQ